jgi:hypothetical protein
MKTNRQDTLDQCAPVHLFAIAGRRWILISYARHEGSGMLHCIL